LSTQNYSRYK